MSGSPEHLAMWRKTRKANKAKRDEQMITDVAARCPKNLVSVIGGESTLPLDRRAAFVARGAGMTFTAIGKMLGCSRERARQKYESANRRVRNNG